jgi:hypothetical protein
MIAYTEHRRRPNVADTENIRHFAKSYGPVVKSQGFDVMPGFISIALSWSRDSWGVSGRSTDRIRLAIHPK